MRRNLELSEKAKTIQYECAPAFLEFRCAFSESAMKIVLLGGLTRVFGGLTRVFGGLTRVLCSTIAHSRTKPLQLSLMPFLPWVAHELLLAAAWLPCALDRRRLASASVSSKAIIAILSKTRPIARMLFSLSISFPPPAFRERRHRVLACRSIAARRRAAWPLSPRLVPVLLR